MRIAPSGDRPRLGLQLATVLAQPGGSAKPPLGYLVPAYPFQIDGSWERQVSVPAVQDRFLTTTPQPRRPRCAPAAEGASTTSRPSKRGAAPKRGGPPPAAGGPFDRCWAHPRNTSTLVPTVTRGNRSTESGIRNRMQPWEA